MDENSDCEMMEKGKSNWLTNNGVFGNTIKQEQDNSY